MFAKLSVITNIILALLCAILFARMHRAEQALEEFAVKVGQR